MASVGDGVELTRRKEPTRLLVGITAVALLVGVVGLVLPRVIGDHDDLAGERQAVITRADDFATTFNTYSIRNKADYQRRVKPLMTTKFYKDFVKITDAMFKAIEDKDQSSGEVKVLSSAVDTMDEDSATAIVALDSAVRRNDVKRPTMRRFRFHITLAKVGSQWRVSDFDAVPPMDASIADVADSGKTEDQQ